MSFIISDGKFVKSSGSFALAKKPAPPAPPVNKGDLITMDLGNGSKQYRVIKLVEGNTVEVLSMYDCSTYQKFGLNTTYAGSDLDTALNTTFFNKLNTNAQNAIISKNIIQYQYSADSSAYNAETHASYANYSTKAQKGDAVDRKIYALDVEDVEEYFGATETTQGTFSSSDIYTLFWNTSGKPSTSNRLRLRSAITSGSGDVYCARADNGSLGGTFIDSTTNHSARAAFQIDLSKIEWSKVE